MGELHIRLREQPSMMKTPVHHCSAYMIPHDIFSDMKVPRMKNGEKMYNPQPPIYCYTLDPLFQYADIENDRAGALQP